MKWNYDMTAAPRDGTLLLLLIAYEGAKNPLEDSEGPTRTVGWNNFVNDEDDTWRFAGWGWDNDYFLDGEGTPTAWILFPEIGD